MARSLKIGFAASEASPFAKTGGLADVAAALPAQLRVLGHDVRLFIPYYTQFDSGDHELVPVDLIQDVAVQIGSRTYTFSAKTTSPPGSDLAIYLIDCPELYGRQSIYTTDEDEARRFMLFSRAVIECCQHLAWAPDVFHCNDWHTALVPLCLRTFYEWDALFRDSRTLVTIHNIGYQGNFPSRVVEELGLGEWTHLLDQEDLHVGRFNFLKNGLIYADAISTVSPTYAREVQTDEYGMGLQQLLASRRDTLVGILNGVDYDQWSPERDAFIPHLFSANDLDGKRKNKLHLLETMNLDPDLTVPLLGVVSRLTQQKGFDLCFEVLPELLPHTDVRLIVLGSGEERYESFFVKLQQSFPRKVCFHRGYHDELAHLIEAASDLFLMPSRYEPCGLNQMFGMRYGTLPIVRRTGGLADSVVPIDGESGRGTGFVFEHFTPDGLRWALRQALEAYRDRKLWRRLVDNAMRQDFSWEAQVQPYLELYSKLVAG